MRIKHETLLELSARRLMRPTDMRYGVDNYPALAAAHSSFCMRLHKFFLTPVIGIDGLVRHHKARHASLGKGIVTTAANMKRAFASELPNIRHLRILLAMAETRSRTRAAERVNVSQPAVTQALGKLDEMFGGPLIERGRAAGKPTRRGEIVLSRAARALDFLAAADHWLRTASRSGDPRLARHVTTTNLRAIVAFEQTGTFAGAARQLGVTAPSVHRAAREFERMADLPVFEPGPALTKGGHRLANFAALALKEIHYAFEEILEMEGIFNGEIVIATSPLVRSRFIPRAVLETKSRYPKSKITIQDGPPDRLIAALTAGQIDVLIGALGGSLPQGDFRQVALFQDSLAIVARADHPLALRESLAVEDFRDYMWIMPRAETPTRLVFERAAERLGIEIDTSTIVETGSMAIMRAVLLNSDSLAVVSIEQFSQDRESRLMAVLSFDLAGTERMIGYTTRSDWQPTALQQQFLKVLEDLASDERLRLPD